MWQLRRAAAIFFSQKSKVLAKKKVRSVYKKFKTFFHQHHQVKMEALRSVRVWPTIPTQSDFVPPCGVCMYVGKARVTQIMHL